MSYGIFREDRGVIRPELYARQHLGVYDGEVTEDKMDGLLVALRLVLLGPCLRGNPPLGEILPALVARPKLRWLGRGNTSVFVNKLLKEGEGGEFSEGLARTLCPLLVVSLGEGEESGVDRLRYYGDDLASSFL